MNATVSSPSAPAADEPGLARRALGWLRGDPRAALSLVVLVLILGTALLAPWVAPYDPAHQDLEHMLEGPSAAHWLGTDDLGRDVLSRLIHGGANSLYAALLAVAVALLIGIPLGLIAGFVGGWTDVAISRLIDTFLSFPAIILAVAVTGAMGIGLTNAMFSVGLVFAPQIARLIRARTLVVRQELYVDAARCFGASPLRLLGRHVLPNAIQPVIVQSTLLLAVALLAEASLSFLGLGVQPPDVSWGAMIARGYLYMSLVPEQMYAPGLIIMVTAVAFNALGESMRTALDPTARGHG
ncbi:ABC transporter permease [Alloalcanivorax profundimaris]|uniref:ABC transporter permease n=1 Tax=Alloalcanivorax profundimaris TaxID=2735259 RepID=UPI000C6521F0|nr:ABC transporter permease [Alloalcanivorax profundimaris]MAO59061.1 diguanylate cyclase [Alcanivorax sp.]MAY10960.1 diguanylate cyclase [Alcanivorax sp.]MBF1801597.1 ABC transporter permease [Alloalcanivorax profundimaris]MBI56228.1 diguanylate cyclase [Alcanivorax sp.]MBU58916.1 diguanylate cyclase [Alcanivorax sp.]|tara:strand:- start:18534 stop:19424 length:891 start_codon:yes stop_codon:yes gene_type:complete